HAHSTLADFSRKFVRLVHSSIFSRIGASTKSLPDIVCLTPQAGCAVKQKVSQTTAIALLVGGFLRVYPI
ncbi:hypothetical protein, partial [Caballeronia glathei]|uniref:hypothetical protein n=1 Tax=Caballeronia glathei TaxID=60547 RepID=UPI001ABB353E